MAQSTQTATKITPSPGGHSFLRESSLLSKLDDDMFEYVYQELDWLQLPSGKVLFEQGTAGDSLFVLVSGRLGAFVRQSNAPAASPRLVGEIRPGECIGEMSVLTGETRSARVTALRDSIVVRLSRDRFRELVERRPETSSVMNELLIQRLRDSQTRGARDRAPAKVLGVVPISEGMRVRALCDALSRELSQWGDTMHLSRESAERRSGTTDIDSHIGGRRLVIWLHEQEQGFEHLLLESSGTDGAWDTVCTAHCDRLLLVADASSAPGKKAREHRSARSTALESRQCSLILIHPDGASEPRNAARWIDAVGADDHYNVRVGHAADIKRLARFLTGNAVTLALAGGGALGMAHIGVLRALEEHGIPVDLACGASAGATIAAQIARGDSAGAIETQTKKAIPTNVFFDLNLPVVSLLRTRSLERGLRGLFADACAEDLWRKFFCVASNLTRARVEVLDRGPLFEQVLASGALPGFFPPQVNARGDLLADGAVLDNLPLDHAARYCSGKRIAVNVIPTLDKQMCQGLPTSRSSVGLLWDRVNPRNTNQFPDLIDIGLRGLFLKGVVDAERIRRSADLYIEPPLEQFSFMNMGAFDKIVRLGYYAASSAVETWLENDETVRRIVAANAS